MKTKVVASIEARMTSSRLPGKVLMEAINNISMLEFMISRVKKAELIDEIVVATTINSSDDPIVELCEKIGVKYFRGSEPDVLQRVLDAHRAQNTDVIVELTGDCPLIDPVIIDKTIDLYLNNDFDYISNSHIRSFPDGLDVQVFSYDLLKEVSGITNDKYDRENVSSYIYASGEYSLKGLVAEEKVFWPELRITLDDKGDYQLIKNIIEKLYPLHGNNFNTENIINYVKSDPEVLNLLDGVRVSAAKSQDTAQKKL